MTTSVQTNGTLIQPTGIQKQIAYRQKIGNKLLIKFDYFIVINIQWEKSIRKLLIFLTKQIINNQNSEQETGMKRMMSSLENKDEVDKSISEL